MLLNDFNLWELYIKKKARIRPDEWGFVCYVGNGDTFIFCSLMEAFIKKYGGKVVIVVPESQKVIPSMFPSINRVVVVKKLPSRLFSTFLTELFQFKQGSLFFGYPDKTTGVRGYKNFNFFDAFKAYLGLDPDISLAKPIISEQSKRKAVEVIRTLHLPFKKTVILAPYCRSVAHEGQLSYDWWYKIRDLLIKNGFRVVTNIGPGEKPIDGTIGLQVPFDEIIPIAEYSGWVIGIRSGLFDILSSANCKLTILYPKDLQKNLTSWKEQAPINIYSLRYILDNERKLNEFEVEKFPTPDTLKKILNINN